MRSAKARTSRFRRRRVDAGQRDALVVPAGALRLDLPSGVFQNLTGRQIQMIEKHDPMLTGRRA